MSRSRAVRLLVLFAGLALGGCQATPDRDVSTLHLAWSSDPATLDPAKVVDVVGANAVSLVYQGLVAFRADGTIGPALAARWTVSDDGLRYRFELDPAAKDSAGRPVGAADVVASFRRLLAPETASPRTWVLETIEGAEAFRRGEADTIRGLTAEEGVVTITLSRPAAAFLALLAMPNAAVVPAGAEPDGTIATGPWRVEERVRDSHLTFARNPHWSGPAPGVERIAVRILPEEFTRIAEWETGRLDVLEVPSSQADRFQGDPRLVRQVALVTEYVGLNTEDPVLSDPRVRRALNHAVNVDRILAKVLGGRGVRAVGAVPPTLPGGGAGEPFEHDVALARRLLDEANVPDSWELELWQRPSPFASQVLEAVQADLAEAGIRSVIRRRDWSALKASIDAGDTDAFFINWYADYPDPENFLVPLFHSRNIGGGGNRARYRRADVDADLDRLERTADPEARARLAEDLDVRIHADAPWIYLWHPVQESLVSDRVDGYRPSAVPAAERWLDVRLRGDGSR
ncbi:MAG: ABC transporter substrate-binding protein [Gemmatimonadetes bacterium]|nr:ABC transporter substrate-binding protein [Gemmatimonadota bacterium]